LPVIIPGNTHRFLRVRAHHVSQGCEVAFGELRFKQFPSYSAQASLAKCVFSWGKDAPAFFPL
jgi:hypothetical protein